MLSCVISVPLNRPKPSYDPTGKLLVDGFDQAVAINICVLGSALYTVDGFHQGG